jgi:hypothetical protein
MDSTLISTPLTSCSSLSPLKNTDIKKAHLTLNLPLIKAASELLKEMVAKNSRKKKSHCYKDVFYNKNIPSMSIENYISRVVSYTQMDDNLLIITIISMNSYIKKNKNIFTLNNIYRLFLASALVNAKFTQDINYSFKFYAKVGGVSVDELQILEFSFYAGIDYDLSIKEETFNQYVKFFKQKSLKYQ